MTPVDYYLEYVKQGSIIADEAQLVVLSKLQRVFDELLVESKNRKGLRQFFHTKKVVRGLYCWGGVGVGKTFLMDCFYHSLPFKQKMRMHFFRFMQRIHDDLKRYQGEVDPLNKVAATIAKEAMVICFDELFVSDIADAMLLGRLFNALFSQGVCLVATSNIAPDDLYKNGLQRLQFLPAIALLKLHTEVIHLPSKTDYRMRHFKEAGVFYTPLDESSAEKMEKAFDLMVGSNAIDTSPVNINDREICVRKRTADVVWFDFDQICKIPRCQHDYLVIASQYKTVFVSNIKAIDEKDRDIICLFISLVDVLYDAKVKLVISAAEPVPDLYCRGHMILEYARTNSRLIEMQSYDYFTNEFSESR